MSIQQYVIIFIIIKQIFGNTVFTTSIPSSKPIHSKEKYKYEIITGVQSTFACGDRICERIYQYSVANNHTFNCYEKHLTIIFHIDKEEEYGFLPEDAIEIATEQKHSTDCKIIKRYRVNKNKVLISIGDSVHLVDKRNVDEFIETHFFKTSDYKRYFMYKFSIYEETTDKLDYLLTFKLTIYWFVYFKIAQFLFNEGRCLFHFYLKFKEEHNSKSFGIQLSTQSLIKKVK